MAAIILPSRFTQQPQYAAPIDLGNPVNRGLLAVAPLSIDPAREIVFGTAGTISGATRSVTAQGLATKFVRSSSQYIEFPISGLDSTSFSLEISCRIGSATVAMAPIAITNAARTHYRSILLRGDSSRQVQAAGWDGSTFAARSSGNSKFTAGSYLHLLATFNSNHPDGYRLYVNGVEDSTTTSANSPAITPAFLQIGRALTDYFDGDAWNAALFNRALTAAEARERYRNVWTLYKAPAKRIWVSVGGGGYTLNASTSALAFTGNGAGLKADRKLEATPSSTDLIGNATPILFNRVLSVLSGSFPVAGNVTQLLANRNLVASPAGFLFTGTVTNILYGRSLPVTTGMFALVGSDAGLVYMPVGSYVLSAATGAFSLIGIAPDVLAGRSVATSSGSFTFTGNSSGLLFGRALATQVGTFTLTGTAGGLLCTRNLPVASASFTLTAPDQILNCGRVLSGSVAAFVVQGIAASLLAARNLPVSTGSLVLTGTTTTLTYSGAVAIPPSHVVYIVKAPRVKVSSGSRRVIA